MIVINNKQRVGINADPLFVGGVALYGGKRPLFMITVCQSPLAPCKPGSRNIRMVDGVKCPLLFPSAPQVHRWSMQITTVRQWVADYIRSLQKRTLERPTGRQTLSAAPWQ